MSDLMDRDQIPSQMAHVLEEIGELKGGQAALERQVSRIEGQTNERLVRLESKVDQGFNELKVMVNELFSDRRERHGTSLTIGYIVEKLWPFVLTLATAWLWMHAGIGK